MKSLYGGVLCYVLCPFCRTRRLLVSDGGRSKPVIADHDIYAPSRRRCHGVGLTPSQARRLYREGGKDDLGRTVAPIRERAEVAYAPEGSYWRWAGNDEGLRLDEGRRRANGHRPPRVRVKHQCGGDSECGVFQCQHCLRWVPWCYGSDGEHPNWCDRCHAIAVALAEGDTRAVRRLSRAA